MTKIVVIEPGVSSLTFIAKLFIKKGYEVYPIWFNQTEGHVDTVRLLKAHSLPNYFATISLNEIVDKILNVAPNLVVLDFDFFVDKSQAPFTALDIIAKVEDVNYLGTSEILPQSWPFRNFDGKRQFFDIADVRNAAKERFLNMVSEILM